MRSGQRVYARGGDLIVTSAVSSGAEVFADGNIHVYGALRGRAMAGLAGDTGARILCRVGGAELISIAGRYRVNEHLTIHARIENVTDSSYQLWNAFGQEVEGTGLGAYAVEGLPRAGAAAVDRQPLIERQRAEHHHGHRRLVRVLGGLVAPPGDQIAATGIANIYARDAMTMRAIQHTLAEASGGAWLLCSTTTATRSSCSPPCCCHYRGLRFSTTGTRSAH